MNPQPAATTPPTSAGKPATRARTRPARRVRRMAYRVPCRVRLVNPATGEVRTVVGETVNISSGGMSLQIAVDVPIGTWVETLVSHPNGDPMFLCGTVVHSRRTMTTNYEVGVETNGPRTYV